MTVSKSHSPEAPLPKTHQYITIAAAIPLSRTTGTRIFWRPDGTGLNWLDPDADKAEALND